MTGDSRQPIAERYSSREKYLKRFSEAANRLADACFLLQEDVDVRAGEEWDYLTE